MKISKKTKYYGIAIAIVLLAIGVYVWYTSQREGFVNDSGWQAAESKIASVASDPEFAALMAMNPTPSIPMIARYRYEFPWILISINEPAGPIKLSRIKAYFDGQVDINPLFTLENAAAVMSASPAYRNSIPFLVPGTPVTYGQWLSGDPTGKIYNVFFPNPPTAPFRDFKTILSTYVAICSNNIASLMTKGTFARTDLPIAAPQEWLTLIPKYSDAEKQALLKFAPKVLSVDDDTDPKVAFTVALTEAKTKGCATGSYQGQTPSYAYVAGGSCTNNDKLLAIRNKLKPEEYQAIIVQVFSLGPPPPPPPAPVAPTIPVPTPAAAAPPPPVDDKSGGPVPVASSSGAYAASCTRCTLLNNQLSCSCDVTAR